MKIDSSIDGKVIIKYQEAQILSSKHKVSTSATRMFAIWSLEFADLDQDFGFVI